MTVRDLVVDKIKTQLTLLTPRAYQRGNLPRNLVLSAQIERYRKAFETARVQGATTKAYSTESVEEEQRRNRLISKLLWSYYFVRLLYFSSLMYFSSTLRSSRRESETK